MIEVLETIAKPKSLNDYVEKCRKALNLYSDPPIYRIGDTIRISPDFSNDTVPAYIYGIKWLSALQQWQYRVIYFTKYKLEKENAEFLENNITGLFKDE